MHQKLVRGHSADGTQTIFTASADPVLIYEYRKDAPGVNSEGYRDTEHSFAKPQGVFRIVVIGDSIAGGAGLSDGKSFPHVLEDLLQKNVIDRRIEVVILARIGYAMSQELRILKKEAGLYHPDLIIWSYCLNDPANPLYHFGNNDAAIYFSHPKSALMAYIARKLFYIRENIVGIGKNKEYHQFLHALYKDQVRAGVEEIGRWSSDHHVPVLFYVHPVFSKYLHDFSRYPYSNIHRDLKSFAERNRLLFLDGIDAFKQYRQEDVRCKSAPGAWFDPWHPNIRGHEIVAEQMASFIFRQQFLSKTSFQK
ncbi:MAG: SGNH/GDSL hydrolase family protein [Candidatus Omnitrophica bacterium]|nr:SGNH/GDSL hydrolase family protein [Candidatus Omnitrophota bacterium]